MTPHEPPHAPRAPAAGDPLDRRFTLIRPLGRGGMAEVWLVQDRELGGEAAAKIVPAQASEKTVALLRRECQNARRLAHPNIVRVFDFHRGDDRCFITMAFVEGEDLGSLRGGAPVEILRALIPVADAVGHAHALGIVHRDLKPENVLRDDAGQPHVLDFGISAALAGDDLLAVAGSGSRCSMSPQQLDGDEPGPADDLYGFGALLYELVTGHPPLWPEITDERIRDAVPDPLHSSHELPDRLQSLASRLLAKTTGQRPADMTEVRSELERILADLERSAAGSKPAKESIRLTPPPRLDTVRPVESGAVTGRSAPKPGAAADPHRRQLLVTTAIIAPLAILALVVFLFLPRWLEGRPAGATRPVVTGEALTEPGLPEAEVGESPPAPVDDRQAQVGRKEAARAALERASAYRDRLDARGAARWAAEGFAVARAAMERGDERLAVGAYAGAERAYVEASQGFEAVAASGVDLLRDALAEGRHALAGGDGEGAAQAFALAATIDPGNAAAAAGLRRVKTLGEVLALLDEGAAAEREGRTRDAERSYRQAASLDPLSSDAQQGVARVQARIGNDAFAAEMSEGLKALENGDHASARAALQRAGALRPEAPGVAQALHQVEQAEILEQISRLREDAVAAEEREDWHVATTHHRSILALDPTIRFARRGEERCTARADLADRLAYHLANPGRLSDDEVFTEATELLIRAAEVDPAGPEHRRRVAELERLVETAGTPLPAVLLSDGLTAITVYKVGRFGNFERRELTLRPGRYTVVGSRPGYRDVRRTLKVEPGTAPATLSVKCEEPI